MKEEKILEGVENNNNKNKLEDFTAEIDFLEKKETQEEVSKGEFSEIKKAQEKLEKVEVQSNKPNFKQQIKAVDELDQAEEKIEKLVQIASEEGPLQAVKIAKTLNSNYVLDNMHDKLIDEKELNGMLAKKGFIEKI